jgi:hypothetical protein
MRRLEVGVVALVLAVLTAVVSDVEMGLAAVASVVGGVLVHATQVRQPTAHCLTRRLI